MQIDEIKLSKEEMNSAIQSFLAFRNVNVIVKTVETNGYPSRGWKIGIETAEMKNAVQALPEDENPSPDNRDHEA